ncbi:MAG: hypothetical protein CMM54_07625 [Rhodospirillaceae bacterium]|nr:hypothetical protein [Rhodospirillaceae bacterium]|tara:strand:- start:2642 stop:3475 length:834 start_codon:yes stop_codon:yes gene_type:complete
MEVILIVGILIAIGLAIGSAMIASSKGRSSFGWFVLTLIFPIAILFVAIAGPVSGATQPEPSQPHDIATAQAEARDVAGALATVEAIEDAHDRTLALTSIATVQRETGDSEGAKKTIAQALASAETIEVVYDRASVLSNIAWAQGEAGDVESAKETIAQAVAAVGKINDTVFRERALADIAKARSARPSKTNPSHPPVQQPSDEITTAHNQTSTLDWEMLLKYDPDVMRSVDKLKPYGEPAVEEFKRAYAAVGGDRSVINHITDVIIKDFDKKIHDS